MADTAPLSLVEVVPEEVGTPRNDGTPGSALYAVPLRLNRHPTGDEAALLRETWDRPPSFTAMHRPGILRVSGDRLVLAETTIEEVERYHAATLKVVLEEVNRRSATVRGERTEAEHRAAEEEARHRANVAELARRIDLG